MWEKQEINRNRPETEIRTVSGIRKLHQEVRSNSIRYKIMCRNLTCYCSACKEDVPDWNLCHNKDYTDDYKINQVVPVKTKIPRKDAAVIPSVDSSHD